MCLEVDMDLTREVLLLAKSRGGKLRCWKHLEIELTREGPPRPTSFGGFEWRPGLVEAKPGNLSSWWAGNGRHVEFDDEMTIPGPIEGGVIHSYLDNGNSDSVGCMRGLPLTVYEEDIHAAGWYRNKVCLVARRVVVLAGDLEGYTKEKALWEEKFAQKRDDSLFQASFQPGGLIPIPGPGQQFPATSGWAAFGVPEAQKAEKMSRFRSIFSGLL